MLITLRSPIDVFVTYDGKRSSDLLASRYAMRHLVSAEVRYIAAILTLLLTVLPTPED